MRIEYIVNICMYYIKATMILLNLHECYIVVLYRLYEHFTF